MKWFRRAPAVKLPAQGKVKIEEAIVFHWGEGSFVTAHGGARLEVRNIFLHGSAPKLWMMLRLWWRLRAYHRAKQVVRKGVGL